MPCELGLVVGSVGVVGVLVVFAGGVEVVAGLHAILLGCGCASALAWACRRSALPSFGVSPKPLVPPRDCPSVQRLFPERGAPEVLLPRVCGDAGRRVGRTWPLLCAAPVLCCLCARAAFARGPCGSACPFVALSLFGVLLPLRMGAA